MQYTIIFVLMQAQMITVLNLHNSVADLVFSFAAANDLRQGVRDHNVTMYLNEHSPVSR